MFVKGSGVSIRVWNILNNSMEMLLKDCYMIKKPSMWTNLTKNLVLLSKQLDEYLIWVFGLFTCLCCVSIFGR